MKKVVLLLLAGVFLIGLISCMQNNSKSTTKNTPTVEPTVLVTEDIVLDDNIEKIVTVPNESDFEDCYQLAEKVAEQYHVANQSLTETDFEGAFLYDSLNTYVQMQLAGNRVILEFGVSPAADLIVSVKCSVIEHEYRDDGLFIQLGVVVHEQYSGGKSSYGCPVDVLLVKANDQIKISDILFYHSGPMDPIPLKTDRWDIQVNAEAIQETLDRMDEMFEMQRDKFRNFPNDFGDDQ